MYLACSVVYTKLANPGSYQCLLFPETTLSLENDSWLAADDDWPQVSSKGGSQVTMNDDEDADDNRIFLLFWRVSAPVLETKQV